MILITLITVSNSYYNNEQSVIIFPPIILNLKQIQFCPSFSLFSSVDYHDVAQACPQLPFSYLPLPSTGTIDRQYHTYFATVSSLQYLMLCNLDCGYFGLCIYSRLCHLSI